MRYITLHHFGSNITTLVRAEDIRRVESLSVRVNREGEDKSVVHLEGEISVTTSDTVESISAQIRPVAECWT